MKPVLFLLSFFASSLSLNVKMAPSWHQNRTDLDLHGNRMNLCDIDMSSHMATMQIIINQYFVAFDAGCTILKEFKDMMAHQSALAAEGADEHDQYWELIWANLGCGLTMITGFCTAINPIDFTIWTSIVLVFGIMIGILISSLCRYLNSKLVAGHHRPPSRPRFLPFTRQNSSSPTTNFLAKLSPLDADSGFFSSRRSPEKEE